MQCSDGDGFMLDDFYAGWFSQFREHVIGAELVHQIGDEERKIIYADWTASGRLYRPIEDYISDVLGPFVANTHTESTLTGGAMTEAYEEAKQLIKQHLNADENDAIIVAGAGMTVVINKLQRMMGLRIPEHVKTDVSISEDDKPVVLITHMEHHSNQTTWQECEVTLVIIDRGKDGLPDLEHLKQLLEQYQHRELKIGSFTACSNVTGIITPIHEMAKIMHQYDGLCFVDYAASAPYVEIDMHPEDALQKLDAVMFSPHKFLGGPGSSGVMVFDKSLYRLSVPDQPGGGTVAWTNPWGGHRYFDDVETREDGGTPGFLQTIKAALAIKLKEEMGIDKILVRESHIKKLFVEQLTSHSGIKLLEQQCMNRLAIFSFYSLSIHFNLIVKLLNDRFGIQVRGGCSCAGTYGHLMLHVAPELSHKITAQIDAGDLTEKPGWVRVSLHPTMSDEEVLYISDAIHAVIDNVVDWSKGYQFDKTTGEFENASLSYSTPGLKGFLALPDSPVVNSSVVN